MNSDNKPKLQSESDVWLLGYLVQKLPSSQIATKGDVLRAEYWKSLPRKFCDACKCWFADNKASIEFHERGKRHQENAQKRIQDIQKRGIKEFKKQKELENEMDKIEKAALAAYERDLRNMQGGENTVSLIQTPVNSSNKQPPNYTEKYKSSNQSTKKKQKTIIKSEQCEATEPSVPNKVWYEAVTDDGYKYYWNSETTESKWDPPDEGFISIEEQSQLNSETVTEQQQKSSEEKQPTVKEEPPDNDDVPSSIGPQPKVDPYGQWVTVVKEEPVQYDLQLPATSENAVEIVIPIHKEESSLKFKEKVIGQLSDVDHSEVTFKKRKLANSQKKNARQRTTDDD